MAAKPRHNPLEDFDYRVDCDDFLLYELARLIEEDRASLEEEEFLRLIETGIHEHVERRLRVRADLALRMRSSGAEPDRTLHAIEDIESPLSEMPAIIYSYTAYLFTRLEQCSSEATDERISTAADTLLDSPDDRVAAEPSIELLGSIRSAASARVLAHVISEPMLDEDLEGKAYSLVRSMWPLPRPYILYSLKPHTHEDIPFRWFQLMVDCDEPSVVDRILEEVVVHGGDADYREDLIALLQLLRNAADPETESKILQVLNNGDIPKTSKDFLDDFLRSPSPQKHKDAKRDSPWASLDRIYEANRRYLAAARLFDSGKRSEAERAIEELLKEEPQYPFALMLKRMM